MTTIDSTTQASSQFEMECINLLCRLECKLTPLKSKSTKPRFQSLDTAQAILIEILDFVEANFDGGHPALIARLRSVHEQTKAVESQLLKSSWNVLKFVKKNSTSEIELIENYGELNQIYVSLLSQFLMVCSQQFTNDEQKRAFLSSGGALICELTERW